jgi:hypothetical protein
MQNYLPTLPLLLLMLSQGFKKGRVDMGPRRWHGHLRLRLRPTVLIPLVAAILRLLLRPLLGLLSIEIELGSR